MYELIRGNLDRQAKGLDLLHALLDEEFSLLMARNTPEIMTLELSIHELVRQLADEKHQLKRFLGGGLVRDYAAMLPEEEGNALFRLWESVDKEEQSCSRQASQNAELSLALLDQSRDMLTYLHERIQPQTSSTYVRGGVFFRRRPDAALISGRL